MRLWKTSVVRKIQKIKSKSNARLKITIVILSENNKNDTNITYLALVIKASYEESRELASLSFFWEM